MSKYTPRFLVSRFPLQLRICIISILTSLSFSIYARDLECRAWMSSANRNAPYLYLSAVDEELSLSKVGIVVLKAEQILSSRCSCRNCEVPLWLYQHIDALKSGPHNSMMGLHYQPRRFPRAAQWVQNRNHRAR